MNKVGSTKRECRLSDLPDLLKSLPELTPEEMESFSIDLESVRAGVNSISEFIRVH